MKLVAKKMLELVRFPSSTAIILLSMKSTDSVFRSTSTEQFKQCIDMILSLQERAECVLQT